VIGASRPRASRRPSKSTLRDQDPRAVSTCRAAEATKLLENIFRSVNIALANELKVVYARWDRHLGGDQCREDKPFGSWHFIQVPARRPLHSDRSILSDLEGAGIRQITKFIELAGEVNTAMPPT